MDFWRGKIFCAEDAKIEAFYSLLTKSRMFLFAFAVLWIYFRHTFYFNGYHYSILTSLIEIGDCGVDIFMFLSGFGLYFSLEKCHSLTQFYRKRIVRILPTVFLLIIAFTFTDYLFYHNWELCRLWNIRYWFYSLFIRYWFIGCILIFYILFPLISKCLKCYPYLFTFLAYLFCIGSIVVMRVMKLDSLLNLTDSYFARLPIFVLGALFAYNKKLFAGKYIYLLLAIISLPLLFYLPKEIQRFLYMPIALSMVCFLPYIYPFINSKIVRFIGYLGAASLEFYLIHDYLLINNILGIVANHYGKWISIFGVLLLVVLASILTHFIFEKINSLILKK